MKLSSYTLWGIQFSLKRAFHLISEFQTFWYSYSIYLFSCFWWERESLTEIKDEQYIKEQTAEGCNTVHLLSKERSWDLSLSRQYHRHFAQAQISQGSQGAATLTLVREHVSCLMMGCRREGKGQTQTLNCSCFPHLPPQQELLSATMQGPYFLTHPYAFCWISSFLLPPHIYLERLGNGQLQFLILFSFPMLFSLCFSFKLCRKHY